MDEKYKRFLVFGYDTYYPGGGLSDCFGSFDTIEEAINAINNDKSDYHDVFDRIEGIAVSNLKELGYTGCDC